MNRNFESIHEHDQKNPPSGMKRGSVTARIRPQPQETPSMQEKRSTLHSMLKEGSAPLQTEIRIPQFLKKTPEPPPQTNEKLIKVEETEEKVLSRRKELVQAIENGEIQETREVKQELSELEKEELSLAQERARILATGDTILTENPPPAPLSTEGESLAPQEVEENNPLRPLYETRLEGYVLAPETPKTTEGNSLTSAYEAAIRRIEEKVKKITVKTAQPIESPRQYKAPELPKIILVRSEDVRSKAEESVKLTEDEKNLLDGIQQTINEVKDERVTQDGLSPADQAEVAEIVEKVAKEAHEIAIDSEHTELPQEVRAPEQTLEEKLMQTQEEKVGMDGELAQAESVADKIAEELEKNRSIVNNLQKQVDMRAEKAGVFHTVRTMGEWWRKQSLGKKVSFSIGLLLAGGLGIVTGSAVVAGVSSTGVVISRVLAGTASFVALEARYAKKAEKEGRERTMQEFDRDTLKALAGAVLFAGAFSYATHEIPALAEQAKNTVMGFFGGTPEIPQTTIAYTETAQQGDSLWSLSEHQLEKNYGEKFTSLSYDQKTYLIDAIKDRVSELRPNIDPNTLAIGETIDFDKNYMDQQFEISSHLPASTEDFTGKEPLSLATPPSLIETAAIPPEVVIEPATIPSEISPADPEIIKQANEIMERDINEWFGTKGIFGIGAQNGMDTINWKDSAVGFAGKTVGEVMNPRLPMDPFAESGGNIQKFGIESKSATHLMQEYLKETASKTGVPLAPNENVQDYIRRAAATLLAKNPLGKYTV